MHQPLSDSRGLSLKLILDSVPLGIVQLDEQRRYLWANPAFLQLVGYSLEELTGMSMLEITHPDDREDSFVASEKLRQPGFELHRLEKRYLRKDGQVVWALVRSRQVFNPEDGAFDLFTVVEDITELKKKEQELQRAEAEMASFFTASVDIMISFDMNGIMTRANPACLELLGWAREEIIGKTIVEYVHPEDQEATWQEFSKLKGGATTLRFENRVRTRDGRYRLLSWTAVPNLAMGAIFAIGRDMTERRQEQAAMTYSAKMASLGEMAGGIAHEVNNPLAIILGKVTGIRTMLAERSPSLPAVREELASIERTGQRIVHIIRGLRAFSRNAEQDAKSRVDLASVCEETLSLCEKRLRNSGIDLQVSCPQALFVRGRSAQLCQVLMNLLSNAGDAVEGAAAPRVDISARRGPDSIVLEVRDNGPGIEPRYAEKIFQPFFTTKEIGRGTGLGLSISKGIVEEHGGTLSHAREGAATVFRIVLPADA